MSFLTPQTFAQLRQAAIEQYASESNTPAATDPGSSLGSVFDAFVLCGLQLQQEVIYVAAISRLYTIPAMPDGSPNPDVDSFGAQYGITRNLASFSSGQEQFTTSVPVVVGTTVSTAGNLYFTVVADPLNPAYNAAGNDYTPTSGQVSATIQCQTAGSIGNVQAGTITQLYSGPGLPSINGVISATNPVAFNNALDIESDTAYKARITLTLMTGKVATLSALEAAILAVQPGLTVSIADCTTITQNFTTGVITSAPQTAFFTVVVALLGTTTTTSTALLGAVTTAIEGNPNSPVSQPPVRAAGIQYAVLGPVPYLANASATIHYSAGYTNANIVAAANAAYSNLVLAIGVAPKGAATQVYLSAVYAALSSIPGVTYIDSLMLSIGSANLAALDLTAPFGAIFVPGTITFTAVTP